MKKTPQDFIIDSLTQMTEIIKNKNEYVGDMNKDETYTYILKSFCDKYSNSFYDKAHDSIFNMYHTSLKLSDIDHLKKTIFISEEAYNILYNPKLASNYQEFHNNKKDKNTFGEYFHNELKLYFEHLTPMSQPRRKLVEICDKGINREDVENCFKYSALALITKEESKSLDGENGVVTEKDLLVLQELKKANSDLVDDFSIKYAESLNNHKLKLIDKKLKNNGNGLIRIIHMVNSGIKFVDEEGKEISLDLLVEKLNKFTFVLDQFAK